MQSILATAEGQNSIWIEDHHGFTPAHCAAHAGNAGAMAALASAKANVGTAKTAKGDTPLHLASMGGHLGVVALLLQAKAEVGARNSEDWTPLHLAVLQGQRDENVAVARTLLENGAAATQRQANTEPWSVVGLCAHHGHTELLSVLLQSSLGADGTNNQGDTALHLGSLAGHADVVRILAKAGGSVNACNKHGQTPAHMALHGAQQHDNMEESREVLRMLSGFGADLHLTLTLIGGPSDAVWLRG